MRRPLILSLLLAANVLNVVANAIVFEAYRHQVLHGLLPWFPLLASAGFLMSMGWLVILVLELPDDAAARLWPGFAAIGGASLLTAAGQWVLYRQYDDQLSVLLRDESRFPHLVGPSYTLPSYLPDSDMLLLIGGLVSAAAWFIWAVLARRDAKRLASAAPQV